jgi:DNA polymerase family B
VTASGRQITKHMVETIAYTLTGVKHTVEKRYAGTIVNEYGKKIKTASAVDLAEEQQDGGIEKFLALPERIAKNVSVEEFDSDDEDAPEMQDGTAMAIYRCLPVNYMQLYEKGEKIFTPIIYGDTDSCYFKTGADNKADAVAIADETAAITNESFPEFLRNAFFCTGERDTLMKAAREIVGIRGVWLPAKKKYTIRVVDDEGKAVDKLKTMGSEMKKADTPKPVQDFLKEMLGLILDGKEYSAVEEFVLEQRKSLVLNNENVLSLGVAKQVNNLDALWAEYTRTEKVGKGKTRLPGHVRASINYNEIALMYEEGPKLMSSGDKGLIFYLKPNMHKIKSIAFPADFDKFPEWFDEHFVVDRKLTEEKMSGSKTSSTFRALKWEVPTPQNKIINKLLTF